MMLLLLVRPLAFTMLLMLYSAFGLRNAIDSLLGLHDAFSLLRWVSVVSFCPLREQVSLDSC
jgi:membrane protein required for beta-lactamase induction